MRRQHSPTAEQHERAVAAAAAAERAKVTRLAAMGSDELERMKRLAAYGIDTEPPTLLQMINDYLQLVNISGRCWGAVYVERARRRVNARRKAAGWTVVGHDEYGDEILKRPAEQEAMQAPGEV